MDTITLNSGMRTRELLIIRDAVLRGQGIEPEKHPHRKKSKFNGDETADAILTVQRAQK